MLETCFLRFLGGDVPPGSLNADPILDQDMAFSTPKICLLCSQNLSSRGIFKCHPDLWDCGMLEFGFEFEF